MTVVIKIEYGVGSSSGWTPQTLAVAFERAGANLRTPMRWIGPGLQPFLERTLRSRFAAEGTGGPAAGKWGALSRRYAAWKAVHYPGRKILARSGTMRSALTNSFAPGAYRQTGPTSFGFGTDGIEYASFHQTGTRRMQARPPFDFGGQAFDRGFRAAGQKGLVAGLRAARLDATE